jgi:hypothetical protein
MLAYVKGLMGADHHTTEWGQVSIPTHVALRHRYVTLLFFDYFLNPFGSWVPPCSAWSLCCSLSSADASAATPAPAAAAAAAAAVMGAGPGLSLSVSDPELLPRAPAAAPGSAAAAPAPGAGLLPRLGLCLTNGMESYQPLVKPAAAVFSCVAVWKLKCCS